MGSINDGSPQSQIISCATSAKIVEERRDGFGYLSHDAGDLSHVELRLLGLLRASEQPP